MKISFKSDRDKNSMMSNLNGMNGSEMPYLLLAIQSSDKSKPVVTMVLLNILTRLVTMMKKSLGLFKPQMNQVRSR